MLFTSFTLAAPPQSHTPAAPPLSPLNSTVQCEDVPAAGVVPADCTYLLNHLDDIAHWANEYITFGVLQPGGRETPIFVYAGFCRLGVLAAFPERRPVDRFRLKDYIHDLREINSRCLLHSGGRWNAGVAPVGAEAKFYAYLGGIPYEKEREGVAQG